MNQIATPSGRALTCTLFALAVLGCAGGGNVPVSSGVMLGAYVPGGIASLEAQTGRPLALDYRYVTLGASAFPWLADDAAHGRAPLIGLAPGGVTADGIGSGEYDVALTALAIALKTFGNPVALIFIPEPTDCKLTTFYGPNWCATPATISAAAGQYVVAEERAWTIFQQSAPNVRFIVAMEGTAYKSGLWKQFYPGSEFTNYLGMDHRYGGSGPAYDFASDADVKAFWTAVQSSGRSGIVTETCAGPAYEAELISTAAKELPSMPQIAGFVLNANPGGDGCGAPNAAAIAAFKAMAAETYYQAKLQ